MPRTTTNDKNKAAMVGKIIPSVELRVAYKKWYVMQDVNPVVDPA